MNINFFNEKSLEQSKNILSNIFLLNMDKIKEQVLKLKSSNCDDLCQTIHNICMQHLDPYFLDIEDYFPSIINSNNQHIFDKHFLQNKLSLYLLENIMLSLHLSKIDKSKTISPYKAIINYFNKSESATLSTNESNKETFKSNTYKKFKDFTCHDNIFSTNSIFYNKNHNIYEFLSHIFIFTLKNEKKCKYIYTKCNSFKKLKSFCELFFESSPEFKDIYFFERIFNINFTLSIYFYSKILFKDLSDDNIENLLIALFPIIYLPNVLNSDSIIDFFIRSYEYFYNSHKIDEFINGIKQLCLYLNLNFIPLYNSLYCNIIDIYCKNNNCNINDIIIDNLNKKYDLNLYKKFYNKFLYKDTFNKYFKILNPTIFHESKLDNDKMLKHIIQYITYNFNFKPFNKNILLDTIDNFDINTISSLIKDKTNYQKKLKNFLLSILG